MLTHPELSTSSDAQPPPALLHHPSTPSSSRGRASGSLSDTLTSAAAGRPTLPTRPGAPTQAAARTGPRARGRLRSLARAAAAPPSRAERGAPLSWPRGPSSRRKGPTRRPGMTLWERSRRTALRRRGSPTPCRGRLPHNGTPPPPGRRLLLRGTCGSGAGVDALGPSHGEALGDGSASAALRRWQLLRIGGVKRC